MQMQNEDSTAPPRTMPSTAPACLLRVYGVRVVSVELCIGCIHVVYILVRLKNVQLQNAMHRPAARACVWLTAFERLSRPLRDVCGNWSMGALSLVSGTGDVKPHRRAIPVRVMELCYIWRKPLRTCASL
eukprot:4301791-Prymnesium_polylepis.2